MKKDQLILIAAVVLVLVGIYAVTLDINSKWHYFTNGAYFGVGLTILLLRFIKKK